MTRRPAPWARTLAVLVAIASSACYVGTDPSRLAVARSPHGVAMRVAWLGSDAGNWGQDAELLAISESGIYLLHGRTPVLYPFGAPAILRTRSGPRFRFDLRSSIDEERLEAIAPYARYPFGLDETGMRTLLDALGGDSVVVRRRQ